MRQHNEDWIYSYTMFCGKCSRKYDPAYIPSVPGICAYCWRSTQVDDFIHRWLQDVFANWQNLHPAKDQRAYLMCVSKELVVLAKQSSTVSLPDIRAAFLDRRMQPLNQFARFRHNLNKALTYTVRRIYGEL